MADTKISEGGKKMYIGVLSFVTCDVCEDMGLAPTATRRRLPE